MDVRRIIAFGKSSFVVSLPKKWLDRYHLVKGDVLFVNQEGDKLIIAPEEKEEVKEEKRTIIHVDKKSIERIRREISAAFVNYTDYIVIEGKSLPENAQKIVSIIQNLVALEIIEQSHQRIVAQDFLRVEDVKIEVYLRKSDITVRSIFADLKNPNFTDYEDINLRQEGINRIYLLLLKIFKAVLSDPGRLRKLQIESNKIMPFSRYNYGLQYLGLSLNNIAKEMKLLDSKEGLAKVRSLVGELEADYLKLMKAIISENKEQAFNFSIRRDEAIAELEKGIEGNPVPLHRILSNITCMHREMHEMAHQIYD